MMMDNEKVAAIPVPPVREKEMKQKTVHSEETRGIREMAKAFRKAADNADRIAEITENVEMPDEQKEQELEEAQVKYILQMMKIQKMAENM